MNQIRALLIEFLSFLLDLGSLDEVVLVDLNGKNELGETESGDEFLEVFFTPGWVESVENEEGSLGEVILDGVKTVSEVVLGHLVGDFFDLVFLCGEFNLKLIKVGGPVDDLESELLLELVGEGRFSGELGSDDDSVFGLGVDVVVELGE